MYWSGKTKCVHLTLLACRISNTTLEELWVNMIQGYSANIHYLYAERGDEVHGETLELRAIDSSRIH